MNSKLRKIINNYGILTQLKYFQSEVFELNEAIMNERKGNGVIENILDGLLGGMAKAGILDYKSNVEKDKEHITEEIADVMVMLKQFQLYYSISTKDVQKVMQSKIKRQLERMEEKE